MRLSVCGSNKAIQANYLKNGTLQFLNQSNNALNGKLPHEIGLLSSLKVIDLQMNQISGWYVPFGSWFLDRVDLAVACFQ
jgi:hypothetical protein